MKFEILKAKLNDADEILTLQKIAFIQEAKFANDFTIQPMMQTLEEIKKEFKEKYFLKAVKDNEIIGSIRASKENSICTIFKLIVHPYYQNKGLGSAIMDEIEKKFSDVEKFQLWTGSKSESNIRFYTNRGFKIVDRNDQMDKVELVIMEKKNSK